MMDLTRKIRLLLVILLPIVAAGCSQLKLGRRVVVGEGDWPTDARNMMRTNMTEETVAPPLSLMWRYDATGGIGSGSPVVVDSLVLVGTLRGELHAMNARTGDRIGWINLGEAINGSPAVHESIVYVAASNTSESLIAYDLREGRVAWRGRFGDIETSPLLADDHLFFGNIQGEFHCVNRRDGKSVWLYTIPSNDRYKGIRSTAAMADSVVAFGCDDGTIYALDAASGEKLWTFHSDHAVQAPVTMAGGLLLGGNIGGEVAALDLRTGTVVWTRNLGSGVYAGMAVAGDVVLAATSGGLLFGLDRRTGRTLWHADLGSIINAAPVISGGNAYVGTLRKVLYCVDITDGKIVFRETVDGRIKTPVAVAYGRIYVASDERWVMAYRPRVKE